MSTLSTILSGVNRLRNGTTQASVVRPDLAAAINILGSSTIWAYGAYGQITSSGSLSGHDLIGFTAVSIQDTQWQVQVASGAAASEVVVGTFRVHVNTTLTPAMYIPVQPPIQIPANERVAARCASGSSGSQLTVALVFNQRPF